MEWGPGHTVVVVPVPELEPFVRDRSLHYDASFVSRDPEFTHAHITLLAPWIADPSNDELARLADAIAATEAFGYALDEVHEFPDGTIHLRPDPNQGFIALMKAIGSAFPDLIPYDGAFGSIDDLVPHLTLDRRSDAVDVTTTRARLGRTLPVSALADRVEVHHYASHDCRVVASWRLR